MEAEQRSEEWFKQRVGRITASAVGSILGVAPYGSRKDIMRRMVREFHGVETEFKGNVATEYGTFHEAGALVEFEMETGLKVAPAPFVIDEEIEWLGASPDGYVNDGALIEIKCPYGLKEEGDFKSIDDQPHYYAQMQLQMFVTNRSKCYFFQWSTHKTLLEEVYFNEDTFAKMLEEFTKFYDEYLIERELPNAEKYLNDKSKKHDSKELEAMMVEYVELKDMKKEIDDKQKALLNGMVALTDNAGGVIANHKLYKTEKQGAIAYAKAVKELLPDADLEPYRGKSSEFWSVR